MLSFPNTETHSHQLPTSSDTACRSSRTFSLLLTEAKLQFGQQNVDESSTHPVITSSMLTRPRKTGCDRTMRGSVVDARHGMSLRSDLFPAPH
jgi:hypothetical protein